MGRRRRRDLGGELAITDSHDGSDRPITRIELRIGEHVYVVDFCPETTGKASYLGCLVRFEGPRGGLRDFPDGECTFETWTKILLAIVMHRSFLAARET